MEIYKETSSLGRLLIKQVDKELAKELIVKNHYSHKWNNPSFGLYNFGIFHAEEPDRCLGVAAYGYVKNPNCKLFTPPENNPKAWMCELNRMWISDELGRNAESILISTSLKMLQRLDPNIIAVQSFADGRLGCGTIYKAANFRYYGYHWTRFLYNRRSGEISHDQNFTNTTSKSVYLRHNVSYLLGDYETFKVKTYRYIYPFVKNFKCRLKQKPYPTYEKGEIKEEWKRDRAKIVERCIGMLSSMK